MKLEIMKMKQKKLILDFAYGFAPKKKETDEEQETIEDCDTVSGATITSKALKKAVINTLSDYRGE